jgi:alanine racemase
MVKMVKQEFYRPTWAEIDLSAIEHNLKQAKSLIGNNTKILAVLKADAYGHGAVEVVKRINNCAVEYFGVATVPEAIELRLNKIDKPILLLTTFSHHEIQALIRYRITPTIADLKEGEYLNNKLSKLKKILPIHIKIDTGMGRIGIWHKDSIRLIKKLSELKYLFLEGIYTHFPSADEDKVFTNSQIDSFSRLLGDLGKNNIVIPLRHIANSAAVISCKNSYLNLVRPGLMLYGLYPDARLKKIIRLKPAMSFKTRIVFLKEISAGRSVSYGRTFIAKKKTKVATLPVGYADGYNRILSNRADVLVRGRRCPVIGRICMDQMMIDVTGINAKLKDEVVLFGRQNESEISVEEIASLCSTIPYEVVCWVSKRVPRKYIN